MVEIHAGEVAERPLCIHTAARKKTFWRRLVEPMGQFLPNCLCDTPLSFLTIPTFVQIDLGLGVL